MIFSDTLLRLSSLEQTALIVKVKTYKGENQPTACRGLFFVRPAALLHSDRPAIRRDAYFCRRQCSPYCSNLSV
jgi:hypothetical protein